MSKVFEKVPKLDSSPWLTHVVSVPMRASVAAHVSPGLTLVVTSALKTPPGGVEMLVAPTSTIPSSTVALVTVSAAAVACATARAATSAITKMAPRNRWARAGMRGTLTPLVGYG